MKCDILDIQQQKKFLRIWSFIQVKIPKVTLCMVRKGRGLHMRTTRGGIKQKCQRKKGNQDNISLLAQFHIR